MPPNAPPPVPAIKLPIYSDDARDNRWSIKLSELKCISLLLHLLLVGIFVALLVLWGRSVGSGRIYFPSLTAQEPEGRVRAMVAVITIVYSVLLVTVTYLSVSRSVEAPDHEATSTRVSQLASWVRSKRGGTLLFALYVILVAVFNTAAYNALDVGFLMGNTHMPYLYFNALPIKIGLVDACLLLMAFLPLIFQEDQGIMLA